MQAAGVSPVPDSAASRAPLSLHQKFICLFDKGDDEGPFGPRYSVDYAWRLDGELDLDALQGALDDVVARHEALRTEIVRTGDDPHQRILPPTSPPLTVRELPAGSPAERDAQAVALMDEVERGRFSTREMPQLRAVLGRFDQRDAVLVLVAHHTAADGWSMRLLMRDLANRYAARRGHAVPDLPVVPQYGGYARWEQENATSPSAGRSREYWRQHYGDAQMLTLSTDYPRSAELPKGTSWHRFLIPAGPTAATLELTRALRMTPFMTLLAAFQVMLGNETGETDIVIPMFTPGRSQTRFHDTVGTFHNFLPIRTDLAGCGTFREVAERTRTACLDAYSHEIAFVDILGLAPELMNRMAADDQLVCAFQVLGSAQAPDSEVVGDLRFTEVRRRLDNQDEGIDVPEGALWTMDILPSREIVGSLGYNNNRWSAATMIRLAESFCQVVDTVMVAPDAPLPRR